MDILPGYKLGYGAVYLVPLSDPDHGRVSDCEHPYSDTCGNCESCEISMSMASDGAFPVVGPELLKVLESRGILEDALTLLETELLPILDSVVSNFPVGRGETIEQRELFQQSYVKVMAAWFTLADCFDLSLDWVGWDVCRSMTHVSPGTRSVSSCFSLVALGSVYDRMSLGVAESKLCLPLSRGENRKQKDQGFLYPDWLPVCHRFMTPDFVHFSGKQRTLWAMALSCVSVGVLAKAAGNRGLVDGILAGVIKCGDHLVNVDKDILNDLSSTLSPSGDS